MSEFTRGFSRGLLLGGGNLFGDDDPSEEEVARLKAQNSALAEQNRRLKADVAQCSAVMEALKNALHDADPEHPLVSPFESGANPLRKQIGDAAWHATYKK